MDHLGRDFYSQPTLAVAKNLIGKNLVVTKNGLTQIGRIIETEAYIGPDDKAAHTRHLFHPAGFLYIYLVYGMHYMLNIITETEDKPAAVLIRALKPLQNISCKTSGPGLLTKSLNITIAQNHLDITRSSEIFISSSNVSPKDIVTTPRIGIDYAGEPWISLPWRFVLKN